MNRYLDDFLEYLEIEKNRSQKTLENYRRYLSEFFMFAKIAKPGRITADAARNFHLYLNRKGLKKNTQAYYLVALRSFLKFLAKRDIKTLSPEKVELGKIPERELTFLEEDEIQCLLKAPEGDDIVSLRDRAILETLFSTGLRVSELTGLDRKKINIERGEFAVRGKGSKLRVVFLSDSAKAALSRYLDKRTDVENALFIRHRLKQEKVSGLRLTPRSIQRMIKKYAVKAGIVNKVTPHMLRHGFATDLLQGGADIRSVQAMLGHQSIATTQLYTHYTDKHLKEIHKKFHGKHIVPNHTSQASKS